MSNNSTTIPDLRGTHPGLYPQPVQIRIISQQFSANIEEFTCTLPSLAKTGADLANLYRLEGPEITSEFV